jgi:hypothetical protein
MLYRPEYDTLSFNTWFEAREISRADNGDVIAAVREKGGGCEALEMKDECGCLPHHIPLSAPIPRPTAPNPGVMDHGLLANLHLHFHVTLLHNRTSTIENRRYFIN